MLLSLLGILGQGAPTSGHLSFNAPSRHSNKYQRMCPDAERGGCTPLATRPRSPPDVSSPLHRPDSGPSSLTNLASPSPLRSLLLHDHSGQAARSQSPAFRLADSFLFPPSRIPSGSPLPLDRQLRPDRHSSNPSIPHEADAVLCASRVTTDIWEIICTTLCE